MKPIPRLIPITNRPVRQPVYAYELKSLDAFVDANRVALCDYFDALLDVVDDPSEWTFAEFCDEQYSKTCALRRLLDAKYENPEDYLDEAELNDR